MENKTTEDASVRAGHETTDVHPPGVWLAGLGLILCCLLVMLVALRMFQLLQRGHDDADRAAAGQNVAPSISSSIVTFPEPRLQVSPDIDLAAMRAREDAELNSYGWIDRKAGVVRLPIERAMELIAQRGLPFRGQPGAPAPSRTVLDMQQARPSDWAKQQQSQ